MQGLFFLEHVLERRNYSAPTSDAERLSALNSFVVTTTLLNPRYTLTLNIVCRFVALFRVLLD